MSVISDFFASGLGHFIKALFLAAVKERLEVYINTEFGRFILVVEAVDKREKPEDACVFWFVAFEGLILRFVLRPNENN